MIYKPFLYQQEAYNFVMDRKEAGLFLDMGMGKTVITLTAVQDLLLLGEVKKVLVIAPLRPCREVWPKEAEKWDHLKDLRFSLVLGPEKKRLEALKADADIYIVNREQVVWLCELYGKNWPFDMIVIDELSSFKSSKAKRFRALRKVRPFAERAIGLTGTPAPNGLLDLWPECCILDQGRALGKSYTVYKETYFQLSLLQGRPVYLGMAKKGAAEEIYKRLEPLCMSLRSEDWLTLPETSYIRYELDLTAPAYKQYRRLEEDMLLPFADGDIDAPNAGVLLGKLLQLTGGAAYNEKGQVKELGQDKLDVLEDLIEAAQGQPVLVYYYFKHEKERILKRFPGAVLITDPGAVDAWNRGTVPVLLANPASAGHGLNLQFGGHIIIWYSLPTSLELYQQANKRLSRPGQTRPVQIYHLLARGTVDYRVLDGILQRKDRTQNALIEAIKARIEELKNDL